MALTIVVALAAAPLAWAEVVVQNDRMYTGSDGSLHIVGEVQNDLGAPLGQIRLTATIYDDHDNTISTADGWSLVNTLMPGMRGPFDLVVTDPAARQAAGYTIEADYLVLAPKSQVIDVTSAELERSGQGDLFITGTVANRGETTANMVSIVATLYDRNGNVATVARAQPEPDYLRANHEGVFVVSLPEKDQTAGISGYMLVAESEEYAAVPEFPIGSSLVLAVSAAGYILLSRYSYGVIRQPG